MVPDFFHVISLSTHSYSTTVSHHLLHLLPRPLHVLPPPLPHLLPEVHPPVLQIPHPPLPQPRDPRVHKIPHPSSVHNPQLPRPNLVRNGPHLHQVPPRRDPRVPHLRLPYLRHPLRPHLPPPSQLRPLPLPSDLPGTLPRWLHGIYLQCLSRIIPYVPLGIVPPT